MAALSGYLRLPTPVGRDGAFPARRTQRRVPAGCGKQLERMTVQRLFGLSSECTVALVTSLSGTTTTHGVTVRRSEHHRNAPVTVGERGSCESTSRPESDGE